MNVVEALGRHQWRGEVLGCGCGWNWHEERTYFCGEEERIRRAHIAHQVDALKAAGFAVVELAEPDAEGSDNDGGSWASYPKGVALLQPAGRILARGAILNSSEAREWAASLLAAADAAEAQS